MAFKAFKETFPIRFKEFDEARIYIENMQLDENLTKEAVDYMVSHKEYYFLIKNLISQFINSGGNRALFDYIFSRLLEACPRRKEDIELYIKLAKSKNKHLRDAFVEYIKSCAEEFSNILLDYLESEDEELRKLAFCMLKNIQNQEIKPKIREIIERNIENEEFIKNFLDYLYLYSTEEDIPCLKKIQEQHPNLKEKIEKIIKSI